MSRIAMDPEVMAVHADMHEEAVELIETKLSGIPTAVDGGLASDTVAVAVLGMATGPPQRSRRLIDGILTALEAIEAELVHEKPEFAPPPPWGDPAMTPRDAFLGEQEVVPFAEAEGRIAAEPPATYPPGIPNVLPGERLTRETLEYITDSVDHGGYVRGAADRELTTLRVIAE